MRHAPSHRISSLEDHQNRLHRAITFTHDALWLIASPCIENVDWQLRLIASPYSKAAKFSRERSSENVLRDFQHSQLSGVLRRPCRVHGSDELDP